MSDPHTPAFVYLLVVGGIGLVAAIGAGLYLNGRDRLKRERRRCARRDARHHKTPR